MAILIIDGPPGWKHPENGLEHARTCERQTSAENLTAAERSARAKIGSLAAAKKCTADRLARERQAAKRK